MAISVARPEAEPDKNVITIHVDGEVHEDTKQSCTVRWWDETQWRSQAFYLPRSEIWKRLAADYPERKLQFLQRAKSGETK